MIFIFSIMISISMWYWVPIISDLLPHMILKALFWVGLLLTWGITCIATPISMIINGKGNATKAVMGMIVFLVATFISYLSYYILPPIIDIFLSADNALSANNGSIYWVGLGIFWAIGMILIPLYIGTDGLVRKVEEL